MTIATAAVVVIITDSDFLLVAKVGAETAWLLQGEGLLGEHHAPVEVLD